MNGKRPTKRQKHLLRLRRLNPVRDGEPFQFRESGRKFHKSCAKKERNFYVRLEKRLARKGTWGI